jgi:hypothetical protein
VNERRKGRQMTRKRNPMKKKRKMKRMTSQRTKRVMLGALVAFQVQFLMVTAKCPRD